MADRPVLSHSQFAKLYGGSREYATGKTGKRGGYYVSRNPSVPISQGGGIEKVSEKPFDVEATKEHWKETKETALKSTPEKERSKVHQGIWTDTDSGKTYLDVSDRVSSLSEALKKGVEQKQIGIYAAQAGKTLSTNVENPATGERTPNPRAQMVAESYGKKEKQWKKRSRMTKAQRASALSEMSAEASKIKAKGL